MDADEARRRAERLAGSHFDHRADASPRVVAAFIHRESQRLLTGKTVVDPYRPSVRPRGRRARPTDVPERPAAEAFADLERLLQESMKGD